MFHVRYALQIDISTSIGTGSPKCDPGVDPVTRDRYGTDPVTHPVPGGHV